MNFDTIKTWLLKIAFNAWTWLKDNWILTAVGILAYLTGYIGKEEAKVCITFIFLVMLNTYVSEQTQKAYTRLRFNQESPNLGLIYLGNCVIIALLMGLYIFMPYLKPGH